MANCASHRTPTPIGARGSSTPTTTPPSGARTRLGRSGRRHRGIHYRPPCEHCGYGGYRCTHAYEGRTHFPLPQYSTVAVAGDLLSTAPLASVGSCSDRLDAIERSISELRQELRAAFPGGRSAASDSTPPTPGLDIVDWYADEVGSPISSASIPASCELAEFEVDVHWQNLLLAFSRLENAVDAVQDQVVDCDPGCFSMSASLAYPAPFDEAEACNTRLRVRIWAHRIDTELYDIAEYAADVDEDYTCFDALPRRFLSRFLSGGTMENNTISQFLDVG